jgi:hypothetical protein
MKTLCNLLMLCFVGLPCVLAQQGQQAADLNQEKLEKDIQNPIANLISVPFQNNLNYPIGAFTRYQDVLNFQPVIPIPLGPMNLITRSILPIINRQDPLTKGGTKAGLGDLNVTLFFSPAKTGKLIWGVGPAFLIPTATSSELGTKKWGAGPSVVALVQPEGWTIGALVNNVWSFAGDGDPRQVNSLLPQRFTNGLDEFVDRNQNVNSFLTQYFITRQLKEGWFLTSSPIITRNWELSSDEGWIVPFGGGMGRTFKIGDRPVMALVQNFYNAIHPRTLPHPQWQLRMQFVLLFPQNK